MELDLVLLPHHPGQHTHTHTFLGDVGHKWDDTTAGRWLQHVAGIILEAKMLLFSICFCLASEQKSSGGLDLANTS